MKTLRASEVGTYLFCQRAWWYQNQGYESANQAELLGGTELHERHGRAVMTSSCLQTLAFALLLLAVVVFTVYIVGKL